MSRATLDIVVLMVAGTVCLILLTGTMAVLWVELVHPETDTSVAIRALAAILEILIAALIGFLAGRRSGSG